MNPMSKKAPVVLLACILFGALGCEKKKNESSTSSDGGTAPPDYSGTWNGSYNDPFGVGSQTLKLVISNWSCGNGLCSFDGTWTTPTRSAPLSAGAMTQNGGVWTISFGLIYTKGCSGADRASGQYNAGELAMNVSGDCSTAGLARVKK